MTDTLNALLASYSLTPPLTPFSIPSGINNVIVGLHTGAGDFVVKTITARTDPALLNYEVTLLRWLATQRLSFTVPAPIPTHTGDILLATSEGYKLLLPLLPGRRPDCTNGVEIEAVGAALGELHPVLARYPSTSRLDNPAYGALDQIHPRLPNPYTLTPDQLGLPAAVAVAELFAWWRAELATLRDFVNTIYIHLPKQVIHSDYGPSNTLYQDGRVTSVLDFEFAGPDVRAIDIAAGLVFSMRLWENPQPLAMATAFCRGYGHRQRLTPDEITAIPWLMRLRNATSSVWWFGRELAAGNQTSGVTRIAEMQQMVKWLNVHEQALLAILWEQVGPALNESPP